MRIAVTNHHGQLTGGTESYLNGVIPEFARRGYPVALWHEAEVASGTPKIDAPEYCQDFDTLLAWRPDVIFNHGLQSPERECGLADIAPVIHFAHNYHGTCISGEKTHKFPTPVACGRALGPGCLAHYLPHRCGGLNPLVMMRDYRTQSGRLAALRRARGIVTASVHMKAEYRSHGLTAVHRVALFANPEMRTTKGGRGLLFAGRMTAIKGGRYLAEAARMLDTAVTFAGDGPERDELRRLCPKAKFTGWVPQEQLRALASEHDVFVMPSVWPEPFGLAGLELAMPVAAFAVGGIPDWLSDGVNGYLATSDPPTARGLAAAIAKCLKDPKLHDGARARASEFTLERHMNALIPILEAAAR